MPPIDETDGPAPADLPDNISYADFVRVVNELRHSDYRRGVRSHKHGNLIHGLLLQTAVQEKEHAALVSTVDVTSKTLAQTLEAVGKAVQEVSKEVGDIKTGLFGDKFGNRGLVQRLDGVESLVTTALDKMTAVEARVTTVEVTSRVSTAHLEAAKVRQGMEVRDPLTIAFTEQVRSNAVGWAAKLSVLIGILILIDYGSKAISAWQHGVSP